MLQKQTKFYLAWHHVCAGRSQEAERQLKEANEKFPYDPRWLFVAAVASGAKAGETTNTARRQTHLETGGKALIAAQKAIPYLLHTMYLHPELAPIARSPAYRVDLRALLGN